MTLSQIRRILLVLLALCIVALGGLLTFVDKEEKPAEEAGIIDVVAICPQPAKAGSVKQELLVGGYQVSASSVTHSVPKPDGYRVVFRGDTNMVQSFHATLKTLKMPCAYIDNKSGLQFGGVLKSEKEAKKKADAVRNKAGVAFKVEPNSKMVKKPCVKFVVSSAPKADAEVISEVFKKAGCVDVKVKDIGGDSAIPSV